MDLFGPLKARSIPGAKYIMVMTDAFSKYTELAANVEKSAETVVKSFLSIGFAVTAFQGSLYLIQERNF